MKKILSVLALVMILSCVLTACNLVTCKVTFDTQGGNTISSQTIVSGKKAVEPKDPVYEGKEFVGWSKDKNTYNKFDFDTVITEDTTIYAIWKNLSAEDVFNNAISKMSQQEYMNMILNSSVVVFEKGELVSVYNSFVDKEEWITKDGEFIKESGVCTKTSESSINKILFSKYVLFDNNQSLVNSFSYSFGDANEIILEINENIFTAKVIIENGLIKKVEIENDFANNKIDFTYVKNNKYYPPNNWIDPNKESASIGISLPTSDLQRWNQDGAAMKQQLEAKGYTVSLQYANNNIATQISQIENMIERNVKVLIISAVYSNDSLNTVLAKAKAKGLVVIAYDRLIMNTPDVDYYVSFDNFNIGVEQGKFIEQSLKLNDASTDGKTFNIEFITGDPGDNNARLFYEGGMSVLGKYLTGDNPKLICQSGQTAFEQVVTVNWSSQNAQIRFETIINTCSYNVTNNKLDVVFATNDSTAQGVTAALKYTYSPYAANFPIITGQDCDKLSVKYIKEGFQSMSAFKDTRVLVASTVEMVDAVLRKTTVPVNNNNSNNGIKNVPAYLCDVIVVTKDNYKEILIDSGYYTESDIA